jgi:hypothetical protein
MPEPKKAAPAQPENERLRVVLARAAAACAYADDARVLHELADQLGDAPASSGESVATLKRERDEARIERDHARAERDKTHQRADELEKQLADLKQSGKK